MVYRYFATGQVPLLITEEGTPLFESDAIVEYIDETSSPLVADISPVQRAIDRAWSYQATKHYLVQCSTMQSADRETLLERSDKLNKSFEKAEKQLGDGPYFNGEVMGNVDIAWLRCCTAPRLSRNTPVMIFSLLSQDESLAGRDGQNGIAEKSVPADFDEAFSNFYLADRTFLGRGANFDETPIAKSPGTGRNGGCC